MHNVLGLIRSRIMLAIEPVLKIAVLTFPASRDFFTSADSLYKQFRPKVGLHLNPNC